MGHIFISYSRKDETYVTKLVEALENKGFEVWIDTEILTGGKWIEVINHKIDTCDAFVVVMTDYSKKSKWVNREVLYAIQEEKSVFPLLLQGKLWMVLQDYNYSNVTDGSIPNEKFFNDIEKIVSRSEAWLTAQYEKAAEAEKARLEEEKARQKAAQEKAERESAEKAAREKAEKALLEAEERAKQEVAQKSVREKIVGVIVKKIAREKEEKKAAEKERLDAEEQARKKAARERAEREFAEKAARERAENEAAEKVRLEAEEKERQEAAKKKNNDEIREGDKRKWKELNEFHFGHLPYLSLYNPVSYIRLFWGILTSPNRRYTSQYYKDRDVTVRVISARLFSCMLWFPLMYLNLAQNINSVLNQQETLFSLNYSWAKIVFTFFFLYITAWILNREIVFRQSQLFAVLGALFILSYILMPQLKSNFLIPLLLVAVIGAAGIAAVTYKKYSECARFSQPQEGYYWSYGVSTGVGAKLLVGVFAGSNDKFFLLFGVIIILIMSLPMFYFYNREWDRMLQIESKYRFWFVLLFIFSHGFLLWFSFLYA